MWRNKQEIWYQYRGNKNRRRSCALYCETKTLHVAKKRIKPLSDQKTLFLNQPANSRSSLVVAPNSRNSCLLLFLKQATISFLCTSIPQHLSQILSKTAPPWMNLRLGTLSIVILLHVLLPWPAGQIVVQMRVPKISFLYRLQAQKENDLCR